MRILALETSFAGGSVALAEEGQTIAVDVLPGHLAGGARVAQSLIPTVGAILASVGWRPADVRLVAVAIGPGSFTGLRVGVTAAKTLAYAIGADVLGVSTLEAIAAAAPLSAVAIHAVIDAQRKQLFAASYGRDVDGKLTCVDDERIVSADDWLARLPLRAAVTGSGLRLVEGRLPAHVELVEEKFWLPSAEHVATLAWRDYRAGRRDDLWRLAPRYIRDSAAEEKARQCQPKTE